MQSLKKLSDEIEKTKDLEAIKKAEKFFYESIVENFVQIFLHATKSFFGICQNNITNFEYFVEQFNYYGHNFDYQSDEKNDYFRNENFLDIQFDILVNKNDPNQIKKCVRVPASEKEIAKICLLVLQNPAYVPFGREYAVDTINIINDGLSDHYYYEIKDNEIYYKPRNNKELIKGVRDLKNEDYNDLMINFILSILTIKIKCQF